MLSTSLAFSASERASSSSLLLVAGDVVALGAQSVAIRRVERGGVGLGAAPGLAFGKRLVTVEEPVERAVVLLQREERVELLAHCAGPVPGAAGGVGGAVAGGAVAGGAVGAVGRRRGRWAAAHGVGAAACAGTGRGGARPPSAGFTRRARPARTPGPGSGNGMLGLIRRAPGS